MGFLTKIASATIKTVLTPVAIVADVVTIMSDSESSVTEDLLTSALKDVKESVNDLSEGDII